MNNYNGSHTHVGISITNKKGYQLKTNFSYLETTRAYDHGIHIRSVEPDIHLKTHKVLIQASGCGAPDRDGIRIDQRRLGSIYWVDVGLIFLSNGGDDVEPDETGKGSVVVDAIGIRFTANGAFCFSKSNLKECIDLLEKTGFDLDDGFDIDEY